MPFEYWRWELVKTTGWTLEYIDALSLADLHEFLKVRDGKAKADNSILR